MNRLRSFGVVVCLVFVGAASLHAQAVDLEAKIGRAEELGNAGRYREANEIYLGLVPAVEARHGVKSLFAARFYNANAINLYKLGEYAASGEWLEKSLRALESQGESARAESADVLNNLGLQRRLIGAMDQSEKFYSRALALYEAQHGPNHPKVADVLRNFATLYQETGRYADADRVSRRALKIYESAGDEAEVATLLGNLGGLYVLQGRYQEGEAILLRALRIQESRLGREHGDLAVILTNLGAAYIEQERFVDAEPMFVRSLAIDEKNLGPEHPEVATRLNNLGGLRMEQGRYDEAEPLYARALKIKRDKLGAEHHLCVDTLANIGTLFERQKKFDDAEKQYRAALQICESALGANHPKTLKMYTSLGIADAFREREPAAVIKSFDLARRGARKHVQEVLPNLSERQQLDFIRFNDQPELFSALSYSLIAADRQVAVDAGANFLVNSKGMGHIASAQRALLLRDARGGQADPILRRLLDIRHKLAELSLSTPEPAQAATRKQSLAQLTTQEAELAQQLSASGGQVGKPAPWTETAEIRRAIPADAVLIDFVKFGLTDYRDKNYRRQRPNRYAAWITPPAGAGQIRVVDLGPEVEIDALVAAVRAHLQSAAAPDGVLARDGEAAAVAALAPDLKKLAAKIWRPLTPHLGAAKQLLISPDGMLWLIPWAALPIDDAGEQPLVEKYSHRLLISGRDVIPATTTFKTTPPVIVADPAFDASDAVKRAKIQATFKDAQLSPVATRGFSAPSVLSKVAALPGTATEADLIQPRLEQFAGGRAAMRYSRDNAFEYIVKRIVRPQVYVFATHGFFLPDQERPPGDTTVGVDASGADLENPLLRCGLLLMGCNDRGGSIAEDDGILTGLEICGLDLRGTQLVVLSACETGVGKVHNGEGVAGLRQAFQLAGAEAVVASLWQVPDRDSALIMAEFFAQLADGQPKAEAIRQAQLARIAARRERSGAAHPFYWAAWTLTGN